MLPAGASAAQKEELEKKLTPESQKWTRTWELQYWSIPEKMITGFFKGPTKLPDESFESFLKKCKSLAEKRDLLNEANYNVRIDAFMIFDNKQCWFYRLKKVPSLKLTYSNYPMKNEKTHMYGLVKKYIGDGDMPAVIKDPSELIKSVVSYSKTGGISSC